MPTSSGRTPKDCCSPASSGVHLRPEEEVADADVAEEADRLAQQREHDQHRRRDRDRGRGEQGDLDRLLAAAARRAAGRSDGPSGHGSRLVPGLGLRARSAWSPSVSGTILAASAMASWLAMTKSMNAFTSGRASALLARVHEQRADQRLVGAVLDRLRGRLDAAVAGVDADEVELVRRWPRSRRSRSSRGRPRRPETPVTSRLSSSEAS